MHNKIPASAVPQYLQKCGIRGIIFDIDGTLLDSMPIWDDLGARYIASLGKVPEKNLGRILFPMTLPESTAYLKEHYQLKESTDEIRHGLHQIMADFYRQEVPLKDGVRELLENLHQAGIPMVTATIGERDLEEAALRRNNVWSYFDHMFLCDDYHTSKKEAQIYRISADFMHTAPAETLVVEDVLSALETAHTAGFITAGVYDAASAADQTEIRAIVDFYFADFHEMEKIERRL